MNKQDKQYLAAIKRYKIHHLSLEAKRAPEVFKRLMNDEEAGVWIHRGFYLWSDPTVVTEHEWRMYMHQHRVEHGLSEPYTYLSRQCPKNWVIKARRCGPLSFSQRIWQSDLVIDYVRHIRNTNIKG